jgi:hypothetical protein
VVGVVVAGVLASVVTPGPYNYGSTMIGVTLLAVLFGYGELPTAAREGVGFAAAIAFSLLLTLGVVLDALFDGQISGWPNGRSTVTNESLPQRFADGWQALLAWLAFFSTAYVVCAAKQAWRPLGRRDRP